MSLECFAWSHFFSVLSSSSLFCISSRYSILYVQWMLCSIFFVCLFNGKIHIFFRSDHSLALRISNRIAMRKKSIINLSTHILIHRLFDTEKLFVVIVGSFSHSASPNVAFHFLSQAPTTHPIRIRIFEFRWHRALLFSHFDVSISNYFIFPKLPIYDISTCWIKKQTKIICKLFFDAFFMFKSFNLFRKLHYSNFWKNKIIEGTFKWLTLEIIKYQHRNDTKQKWTPKKLRNRWRNNKKKVKRKTCQLKRVK